MLLYCGRQNGSMFLHLCLIIDHRRHQNMVKKTSVTHSAVTHVWLFCSYYILLSSVIYHWVYAGQHEIQIFNWYLHQITFGNKNLNKYHSLFLWYDAKCRWESSHKLLLKSWRKLQKNFCDFRLHYFYMLLHKIWPNLL